MLWKWGSVVLALQGVVQDVGLLVWGWGLYGVCPRAVPLGQQVLLQDLSCFYREPLGVWGIGVSQHRSDLWWHGIEENCPLPCLWVAACQTPHVEQELHWLPVPQGPLPGQVYKLCMLRCLGPPVAVDEGGVQGLVPAPHRLRPGEDVLHLLQCLAGEGA